MEEEKNKEVASLKIRLKITAAGLILITSIFAAFAWASYDYWAFKILVAGNYIYTDALNQLCAQNLGEQYDGAYTHGFDRMVMAVVTGAIRETNGDQYTYLYTPSEYKHSREYEKKDAERASLSELSPETVLIVLPNISSGTKDFLLKNKDKLASYDNIIIDLRHNYGGLLADGYAMAELFLPEDAVIGYETARSAFFSRQILSKGKQFFRFENIIIIQDAQTASAAESVISALKENLNNVTLVGSQTFGKGIAQLTVPLTGGFAVKCTVLSLETPSGESIHGIGIPPDMAYDGENIVDYVLDLIETNKL